MWILIVLAIICIIIFILDYLWKPKLPFPMPSRMPLVGHALSLGKFPHQKLTVWGKELGCVYNVQIFGNSFLVLKNYDYINEVLREKTEDYAARPIAFRGQHVAGCTGNSGARDIFSQDLNPEWRKMKDYIRHQMSEVMESGQYSTLATEVCKDLSQMINSNAKEGIVDPYDAVHTSLSCYYYSMIFGSKQSLNDEVLKKMTQMEPLLRRNTSVDGRELDLFPWLRHFGNRAFKIISDALQINKQLFALVKEKITTQKPEVGIGPAFMGDRDGLNIDEEVRGIVLGNNCFHAAIAPSLAVIYGGFMIMATHQEIQDKLFAEISATVKRKNGDYLTSSDRGNMPYMEACLHELLRYVNAVPLFTRRALVDTTLQGISIPKDTLFIINSWAHHHSEVHWKSPFDFTPERFLDSEGRVYPPSHPLRKKIVQQGAGLRSCVGAKSSDEIIFLMLANTVKKFSIKPVGGIDIPFDPRKWEDFSFAFVPNRCQMRFEARE